MPVDGAWVEVSRVMIPFRVIAWMRVGDMPLNENVTKNNNDGRRGKK